MRRAVWILLLATAASCAAVRAPVTSPGGSPAPPSGTAAAGAPGDVTELVRVVDGDTIVVRVRGVQERVRLIGVDTPERDRCFFEEATDHLRALLAGRSLTMARDVRDRDRFGRLLRFVFADGAFVNAALVRGGYARVDTVPPDVSRAAEFRALQREARAARLGLWSAC